MKVFYIAILIATSALCHPDAVTAQQLVPVQDTLVWQVNQMTDALSDTTLAFQCRFEVYANSHINWIQNHEYSTVFHIDSIDGTWEDVSEPGTLKYSIRYENKPGHLTMQRTGSKTTVELVFDVQGIDEMSYTFQVNSVTQKQ